VPVTPEAMAWVAPIEAAIGASTRVRARIRRCMLGQVQNQKKSQGEMTHTTEPLAFGRL
jgi:hypothetical protein